MDEEFRNSVPIEKPEDSKVKEFLKKCYFKLFV